MIFIIHERLHNHVSTIISAFTIICLPNTWILTHNNPSPHTKKKHPINQIENPNTIILFFRLRRRPVKLTIRPDVDDLKSHEHQLHGWTGSWGHCLHSVGSHPRRCCPRWRPQAHVRALRQGLRASASSAAPSRLRMRRATAFSLPALQLPQQAQEWHRQAPGARARGPEGRVSVHGLILSRDCCWLNCIETCRSRPLGGWVVVKFDIRFVVKVVWEGYANVWGISQ